jgi:hypothetical protein
MERGVVHSPDGSIVEQKYNLRSWVADTVNQQAEISKTVMKEVV